MLIPLLIHLLIFTTTTTATTTTVYTHTASRSKRFYALFTDELGLSLLLLCNVRESYAYPSTVFQSVLNLFSVLINTIGPCMRIVLECFIRQVVLKALIQTYSFFSYQVFTTTINLFLLLPLLLLLLVLLYVCY